METISRDFLSRLGFRARQPAATLDRVAPCNRSESAQPAPSRPQGYVDEQSDRHVAGWVWDLADTQRRVPVEVVSGQTVIAADIADRRSPVLRAIGIGDAAHAFDIVLPRTLSGAERDQLTVRPVGGAALERAPALVSAWEPVRFVAMDIVDNCNLRCPFCLHDYAGVNRTNTMPEAVFRSALRLIDYTTDRNFWLSCLHEPTLHPGLADFLDSIPERWNRKAFFTTNLAKRMPLAYFERVARSNLHNINVSIESLRPDVYERMRKGARQPIFAANLDMLVAAFAAAPRPPRIRYIIVAFRSNLDEIPSMVRHLLTERMAWQVEIRHAYPVGHIPASFSQSEFLPVSAWGPLADALVEFEPDRVLLVQPVSTEARAEPSVVDAEASAPGRPPKSRLEIQMRWNGAMTIRRTSETDQDHMVNQEKDLVADVNISDIQNVEEFVLGLVG